MAARDLPFMKFYPRDWMSDEKLRLCSLAARGLWLEVLCLMHQNTRRRGYLEYGTGAPVRPDQLARAAGADTSEVVALLAELEEAGVFSRDENGVIFSRRMVADEGFREACADAGRRGGGNPALSRTFKGSPKGVPKGRAKGVSKGDPNHAQTSAAADPVAGDPPKAESRESGDSTAGAVAETGSSGQTFKGSPKGAPKGGVKASEIRDQRSEKEVPSEPRGGTAHARCVAFFCDSWRDRYGDKYPFDGGKDGTAVRDILKHLDGSEDRFREVVARYLADPDPFAAGKRHPIGILRSQLATWMGERPTVAPVLFRSPGRRTADDALAELEATITNGGQSQ